LSEPHDHHDHDQGHDHEHHHEHVDYGDAVRAFRAEKDEYFRTSSHSPLPPDQRASFPGIPYFDVDEAMVFEELTLEPYTGGEPTSFEIPTSDNQLRPAERAGVFRFEVGGIPCSLTAYAFAGRASGPLFLPFLDGTTGEETYGAGRYLDLQPEDDGTYVIDFNLAYHPSCVYDMRFSCPLTPAENRLPVRIEAGERLADDHH
jgi:uncharacterized protein (DUF1684 family)